jgi:hypothetical protein
MSIESIASSMNQSIEYKQLERKLALKFSDMRLQLYRIQAEGDLNSSNIAKIIEQMLDECIAWLGEVKL